MSQCKKFAPNIFHKTKCSNCFRQKEEHSAEALECNRASRSIARSGYLFVAPDWDFSVPLNRTKRWQRRWFVLYDDGELNYSVDEHPDTVPQGSVDMSKVLEVTGAEQVTGHPHSLALTSPDRVTFVKAASREDARWWAELLAVFPRRHKRNATFPGGRASPSLPQLGRSASPQPPRPRHLSCTGPSPRTNFTTPPLKEEKESPSREETSRPIWVPEPTQTVPIESIPRTDYVLSSGSPPTRDKLRCDDKARTRRDWRHERLRDIATDIITDRSPESSLALPAEGLLNLKKGWLWYKFEGEEWIRRWWVLCGPTLNGYQDQDEQGVPEVTVELSTVTGYSEIVTDTRYGFQIDWSGPTLTLSAVTGGIRSNWLQSLKKAAPSVNPPPAPITPRSLFFSSDEEYRTASEGGRRDSEDWSEQPSSPPLPRNILAQAKEKNKNRGKFFRNQSRQSTVDSVSTDELDAGKDFEDWSELPATPPLPKNALARVKEKSRARPKLPRSQSRQSTVDSVSTDDLDTYREPDDVELRNTINKQSIEIENLKKKCVNAGKEIENLETEISRLKKAQNEATTRENEAKELLQFAENNEKDLSSQLKQLDEKSSRDQKALQKRLAETEKIAKENEERAESISRELQAKQRVLTSFQEELASCTERLSRSRHENERLFKKIQDLECKGNFRTKRIDSLTDLTNIDLEIDLDNVNRDDLIEHCMDLRSRFEKAVIEIRAVKRELRESHVKYDHLELKNTSLRRNLEVVEEESRSHSMLMANRIQDLTNKLAVAERQARNLKAKLQDSREKRRSLSLKGRENFSINKEVEDKVTELEAKILALERGRARRKHRRDRSGERSSPIEDRSPRRPRRKSLDSATTSEPMKLLMRLSSLETKVANVNTSNESLNTLVPVEIKTDECYSKTNCNDPLMVICRNKLKECLDTVGLIKTNRVRRPLSPSTDALNALEHLLKELSDLLCTRGDTESNAITASANSVVKQLVSLLNEKLVCINERKCVLREENKLDDHASMQLLAEKIAYENIIIGRIKEALESPATGETTCERFIHKELIETRHLINSLHAKLKGTNKKEQTLSKTTVEYLTKILAHRLMSTTTGTLYHLKSPHLKPLLERLNEEQIKLHSTLNTYKNKRLPQLAEALANEALTLASDSTCRLRATTLNDAWKTARETVNSELIQSEINHVLMRAAQIYESNSNIDQNFFFTFFASERAALELWADSVQHHLRIEMEKNINELTELFKNSLGKLQRQNWRRRLENERSLKNVNVLLNEFADIIAHKALIDSRVNVLSGEYESAKTSESRVESVENLLKSDSLWDSLKETGLTSVNLSLEAEFKSMFDMHKERCLGSILQPQLDLVQEAVRNLAGEVDELEKMVDFKSDNNSVELRSVLDVCKCCQVLQNKLFNARRILNEDRCFKKRTEEEERRPLYLGTEYLNQVENLRAAYRRTLEECESRKQQADLEQLQVLCERVLVAMEHWHRRTLQELRESHAHELQMLRQDKEQALTEETQATLAALDAMRKAHEAEVQREVARFKQDFARHQQNELLELSERLSVKCLEAAALEEQLGSTTRQLAHAQQHILQLERNPQLSLKN